jgi:DNA-binding NarL/FixJ family response regulator
MIIRRNSLQQTGPRTSDHTDDKRGAVRMVLVDDHPIVLNGLRILLASEPEIEIVAAAPDGVTALEMIRAHEPDIALLDINMPELTGLGVLDCIEADGLSTRVVFLSGTASDEQIATAVERGAWGLLLKESAPDTLIECLRAVASGQRWLPEALVASAIRRAAERLKSDVQLQALTPRQHEIARLLAQGHTNKHIARALGIVEGTVKIHLSSIYEKLGVTNRTALAMLINAQRNRRHSLSTSHDYSPPSAATLSKAQSQASATRPTNFSHDPV